MFSLALVLFCSLASVAHAANYLVLRVPSTGQIGSYSRPLKIERFPADANFTTTWEYQDGTPSVDQVRLKIRHPDGESETFTDWITIDSLKRAAFTLNLPKGRYALEPQGTGNKSVELMEQIVVGAPGPLESVFWSCRTRFEVLYNMMGYSPCAPLRLDEWPPKIRKFKVVLPAREPFPQEKMLTQDWAKLAYVYDLQGYGKSRRNFVSMPNPTETHALSWFPTYFHSSIDGTRIPLTEGHGPTARFGHIIDAIPHPQGRGFYTAEVQGRVGLLETTGKFTTFFGSQVSDSDVPYYSELTVSNSKRDREFASARQTVRGDWQDKANSVTRRLWGMEMWASPAPHNIGLHQGIVFDTFRHRLLYFDHRAQHAANDAEGSGPGHQTIVKQVAGTYNVATRPCFDHPWMGRMDPLDKRTDKRWLYWTVRGGQPSSTDRPTVVNDPGRARICRAEINLATGALAGPAEVWLESIYEQISENEMRKLAGGEFSPTGPAKVRAAYPEQVDGKPGFVLPNAMGFDSQGNLWFTEQCAQRLRVVDRNKVVTTRVQQLGKPRTCYEITANIDIEGVIGPVDTIYGGTYGADSDFVAYPDGSTRRVVPWTGLTPPMKEYTQGPFHQSSLGLRTNYQWLYAPGNKALPCMLAGQQAIGGVFLLCRRTAAQETIDIPKIVRGLAAWRNSHGPYPAPALLGGQLGFNAIPAVGFPELATWDRHDAEQWLLRRGLTAVEADDVLYTAKVQFAHKEVVAGTEVYP